MSAKYSLLRDRGRTFTQRFTSAIIAFALSFYGLSTASSIELSPEQAATAAEANDAAVVTAQILAGLTDATALRAAAIAADLAADNAEADDAAAIAADLAADNAEADDAAAIAADLAADNAEADDTADTAAQTLEALTDATALRTADTAAQTQEALTEDRKSVV